MQSILGAPPVFATAACCTLQCHKKTFDLSYTGNCFVMDKVLSDLSNPAPGISSVSKT